MTTAYDQNVDYYVELGVNPTADQGMINKAFRKMSVIHHPDKPTGNQAKFQAINNVHEDPALGQEHDFNRRNNGSTVAKSIVLYPGQFFLIESHPTISATKKSQLVLRHVRHVTFLQINWAKANESLASAKYWGKHNIKAIGCPIPTTIWSNF